MRAPDIEGVRGKAWKIISRPDHQAHIAGYIVSSPHYHPIWSYWLVNVCHLRDLPGVPPAYLAYPGAEYEFCIQSCDPTRDAPDPDHPEKGYHTLCPVDVVEQFDGVSDDDARRMCEACVRGICDGLISPDQDYRSLWKKTIATTASHFRSGAHVQH